MGEILALLCAFFWAISVLILRTQTHHLKPLTLNLIRIVICASLICPLLFLFPIQTYRSLPWQAYGMICGSLVIGLMFGDTCYIQSIALLGAARAMPLTNAFPVFAILVSPWLTGEQITLHMAIGTSCVVAGVTMIVRSGSLAATAALERELGSRAAVVGVLFGLIAALSWTVSTSIHRIVFVQYNPDALMVATVRMSFIGVISALLLWFRPRDPGQDKLTGKNWLAIVASALCGPFLGGILFVGATKYAGVARVASLVTTAPIYGVPLAVLYLGERINRWTVLGATLTLLGAWTVSAPPEWQLF